MTRHRFDPFSFIAGGVAIGVAVAVLLDRVSISLVDLRIAGPVLILVLGLALLLSGSGSGSGSGRERDPDPAAAATDDTAELDVDGDEPR